MHHYPCTGLWLGFDKGSRTTCCIVWYNLWSISTSNASAVNWTASTTYRIHAFTFREMWHYKTLRMAGRLMKQKHFVTTIRGRNWPFFYQDHRRIQRTQCIWIGMVRDGDYVLCGDARISMDICWKWARAFGVCAREWDSYKNKIIIII